MRVSTRGSWRIARCVDARAALALELLVDHVVQVRPAPGGGAEAVVEEGERRRAVDDVLRSVTGTSDGSRSSRASMMSPSPRTSVTTRSPSDVLRSTTPSSRTTGGRGRRRLEERVESRPGPRRSGEQRAAGEHAVLGGHGVPQVGQDVEQPRGLRVSVRRCLRWRWHTVPLSGYGDRGQAASPGSCRDGVRAMEVDASRHAGCQRRASLHDSAHRWVCNTDSCGRRPTPTGRVAAREFRPDPARDGRKARAARPARTASLALAPARLPPREAERHTATLARALLRSTRPTDPAPRRSPTMSSACSRSTPGAGRRARART